MIKTPTCAYYILVCTITKGITRALPFNFLTIGLVPSTWYAIYCVYLIKYYISYVIGDKCNVTSKAFFVTRLYHIYGLPQGSIKDQGIRLILSV